jgi:hypothetical protein
MEQRRGHFSITKKNQFKVLVRGPSHQSTATLHGVVFEKFALMSLDSIAISVFRAALLGAASELLEGWSAHSGSAA